jgi:hypothetical protein
MFFLAQFSKATNWSCAIWRVDPNHQPELVTASSALVNPNFGIGRIIGLD